jgi:hypothetical protein
MPTSLVANEWRLEWFIVVDIKSTADFGRFLLPVQAQTTLAIKWAYLGLPFSSSKTHRLSTPLREELKAAVRKRSGIPGNTKQPFLLWRQNRIPFEAYVIHEPPGPVMFHLRTGRCHAPLSASDLLALSILPTTEHSPIRYAVDKLSAYLQTGDVKARVKTGPQFAYYPCIHLFQFSPHRAGERIADSVPWHELASIGTRHPGITEGNTQLLPAYKAKNYSIRDDVCVIDKQSLLIVSPSTFLEFSTLKHCITVSLQIRHFLQSLHTNAGLAKLTQLLPLLTRIRHSEKNPSVLTDSVSFQAIWSRTLNELQVLHWASHVEARIEEFRGSKEPTSSSEDSSNRSERLPSSPAEPAKRGVLFALHGIRTHAPWQRSVSEVAGTTGWRTRLDRWYFGHFSCLRFLLPWQRETKVRWFRKTYDEETHDREVNLRDGEYPSIIVHSFGAYILGNALLKYDWLRFDKVILCGSILPPDFPWDQLIERGQVQAVRNECGARDFWTWIVTWFVRGTGPSGRTGFICRHDRFEQEAFYYDHSEYFEKGHMRAKWLPFLSRSYSSHAPRAGTVTRPRESRPWGLYFLYLLLGVLVLGVLGWWSYMRRSGLFSP